MSKNSSISFQALVEPAVFAVLGLFGASASSVAYPPFQECVQRMQGLNDPDNILQMGIPHLIEMGEKASNIDCSNIPQLAVRSGSVFLVTAVSLAFAAATTATIPSRSYMNQTMQKFNKIIKTHRLHQWELNRPDWTIENATQEIIETAQQAKRTLIGHYKKNESKVNEQMASALTHVLDKIFDMKNSDQSALRKLGLALYSVDASLLNARVRGEIERHYHARGIYNFRTSQPS